MLTSTETTNAALDVVREAIDGATPTFDGQGIATLTTGDLKRIESELMRLADDHVQVRADLAEALETLGALDQECAEMHSYCERLEAQMYGGEAHFS